MELENQVVGIKLGEELKLLGINQNSLYSYFHIDEWNIVIRETDNIFSPSSRFKREDLICAAHTVGELGPELPSSVEFGNKKYYLIITRTEKGEWFNPSDYYVGYQDIYGNNYLHSERDDNEANARAKMKIWLLRRSDIIK